MKASKSIRIAFLISIVWSTFIVAGCGGSDAKDSETKDENTTNKEETVSNDPMENKGIGPVTTVTLGDIDQKMADEGKSVFDVKCVACHKMGEKFVGPNLEGVTTRRTPEWIMNMILNPTEMVAKDPIAKQLLGEMNGAQMANQNLTEAEARSILEYFRSHQAGNM